MKNTNPDAIKILEDILNQVIALGSGQELYEYHTEELKTFITRVVNIIQNNFDATYHKADLQKLVSYQAVRPVKLSSDNPLYPIAESLLGVQRNQFFETRKQLRLVIELAIDDLRFSKPPPTIANPSEALRIFDDLVKQFTALEFGISSQESFTTVKNLLDRLRSTVEKVFGAESHYLLELRGVQFRYARAKQKNAVSYFNTDKARSLTVLHKILDELRVIHPSVALISEAAKIVPSELQDSLAQFRRDYPASVKTAFIMMSFDVTSAHSEITRTIKISLSSLGIIGLRADDKEYHPDLYGNVLTYMHGCSFGIAVFDTISAKPFNPNVALEVGYMLALNKRVCLLKDKTMPNLQADLIGKLYLTFDPQQITTTIQTNLSRWLATHAT